MNISLRFTLYALGEELWAQAYKFEPTNLEWLVWHMSLSFICLYE